MTYSDRDGGLRSGGRGNGSRRQRSSRGSRPISPQGSYHGPRGIRQRNLGGGRDSRGPGYPLKARNINFQSGRARRTDNWRLVILAAIAVVLLILVIVGISSCVRGCSADQNSGETNPVDARVAAGVPEDLTREFASELNRGEKLAQIAANANQYADQGLLELALAQPDAIDFVAAYPDSDKTAQAYEDSVSAGTVPELYCWDSRWGGVDYAGRPLALTGSGPTALSMAYMAITGQGDRTPADIAQLVTDAGQTSEGSGMSGDYLTNESLGELGLSCTSTTSNADNLTQALDTGTYVLLEVSAGTLTDEAHWVIVTGENDDGSVTVHDPTSPEASSHAWDPANLSTFTTTIYVISAGNAGGGE
ncbi:papain-like cysteine protease family protein [Olsenella profusa]|uniref:papain-like cysteine protease family protein n=1 Tax=Olsenella profusa TaxID=138595 RepID=UPI001EF43A44|nr:papain-like cysteine protease family protein [Olsenella profusa]